MQNEPERASLCWREVVLTGSLIAVVGPILAVFTGEGFTLPEALRAYAMSFVFSNSIALIATGESLWVWPRIRNAGTVVKLFAVIGVLLSAGLAGSFVAVAVLSAIGFFDARLFWPTYVASLRWSLFITFTFGAGAWAFEYLRARLQATTLELRTQQLEKERMQKLATEAQLASLESRIHPHFLFNALNSISSLIREDPAEAERLVGRMAALLRFSLDSARLRVVPLVQEIEIVNDYLAIEEVRFGSRLCYSVEIPPDLEQLEVPPLAVQTLVENSIKYAVAPSRRGGIIRVLAETAGPRLRISVCDDGPGFPEEALLPAHGIDNLQQRLATLYGGNAGLSFDRGIDGMRVTLDLPQRAAAAVA